MTLEKLLIFGFALAALVAINVIGGGMFDDLNETHGTMTTERDTLQGKKFE